ncbi:hypothetical protein [Nocardioides donggukensis]|uniref:Uncharacterized protein n=1 Tax=Nocardioides donggukensis TaxID=2774019 RepID=A0A927K690_9ACTN|nr:hypothetical protein [Nocardioides donggukensis]MBD8869900.1 hypothetical protein [Nocardioides donggukensis]
MAEPTGTVPLPLHETLQGGPSGPASIDPFGAATRRVAVLATVFTCGALAGAAGAGAYVSESQYEDRTPASRASVQLVITGVADHSRAEPMKADAQKRALWLDGVLMYMGERGAAIVTRVHRPGRSLRIRVPDLPVSLTAGDPPKQVQIRIAPRDCELASMWTPSARPFRLTWRAADGDWRTDPVGDHNASVEVTLIAHMDSVCDARSRPRAAWATGLLRDQGS